MSQYVRTMITLLLASSAVLAGEAPLEIGTKTLRAGFSNGSLWSLTDSAGRVYVRPPVEPRGLGIHRTETAHYATSAETKGGSGAAGRVVRGYDRFTDLDGAEADCTLRVDGSTGDLVVSQQCTSPAEGVWGVSWQVGDVPLDYAIIVPGRSGIRLTQSTPGREHQFDYPMGWEAQLVICEGREGGFYVWADDVEGRFKRLIVRRSNTGWQLTLVTINFAPFDALRSCESVAWRLNVYRGDWRVPARRYREWAEANLPDAVKKELRISIVQAQFKEDGVIPPGFDMTEPRESFSPITDYRTLKMAQVMEAHFGITVEAEDHPDKEEADANNDAFRRGKMKDHYVQGPSDAVEPPLADDRPASDQDEPEYHKDEDGSVSYK